ncbi:MAG: transposase [Burkholderiales bacterium]
MACATKQADAMDQSKEEQRSGAKARERVRHRRYTVAQKLAIVRECLEPGASLAGVALAHRANANMVRKWVVKFQRGGFGPTADSGAALLPVVVRKRASARGLVKPMAAPVATLEIELPHGVVRFYGPLDPMLLDPFIVALTTGR